MVKGQRQKEVLKMRKQQKREAELLAAFESGFKLPKEDITIPVDVSDATLEEGKNIGGVKKKESVKRKLRKKKRNKKKEEMLEKALAKADQLEHKVAQSTKKADKKQKWKSVY